MSFETIFGMRLLRTLTYVIVLIHGATYAQGTRHEHGASTLQVSIEKNILLMKWESPLDDLIGFEYAPKTEREKAAARKLKAILNDPALLFKPNADAGCRVVKVAIDAPTLEKTKDAGPKHHTSTDHAMHTDLEYAVTYNCSNPRALATLDIAAFKTWPAIRDIDVSLVGPGGQSAQEANRRSTRVSLREVAVKQ
jgi:hypothetical protein